MTQGFLAVGRERISRQRDSPGFLHSSARVHAFARFRARNPAQPSQNVLEPAVRPSGYFGVSQEAKTMTKTLLALATASTLSLSMAMAQSPTPPAPADTAAPKASMTADSGSVIAAQKPD